MPAIEDQILTLTGRVALLERRGRRQRNALYSAAIALLALPLFAALSGALPPVEPAVDEVRATRFVLVDDDGEVRGSWSIDGSGATELVLQDDAQVRRLIFKAGNGETTQLLRDGQGMTRLGLSVDSGEHPHLVLSDAHSKPRLHLSINRFGSPTQLFIHKDGTMPVGLGVLDDGRAWINPLLVPEDK